MVLCVSLGLFVFFFVCFCTLAMATLAVSLGADTNSESGRAKLTGVHRNTSMDVAELHKLPAKAKNYTSGTQNHEEQRFSPPKNLVFR